jgi:HAD superfamily hydrolase (TIGR01662 family)
VFVDRDGTLIVERSYLADPAGVVLVPGAAHALTELQSAGFALVLVTNQSGIALGLYTLDDYHAVAANAGGLMNARPTAVARCRDGN